MDRTEYCYVMLCYVMLCSALFFDPPRRYEVWLQSFCIVNGRPLQSASTNDIRVHVLMLSCQAVRGLPRTLVPAMVPSTTSLSEQVPSLSCVCVKRSSEVTERVIKGQTPKFLKDNVYLITFPYP